MKRLLLFFALCSSLGAWAQTAEFSEPEAGTLRITASGDLTNYSLVDESKKVFTNAAANAVFVDNNGSKSTVGGGQAYDPSKSYYSAEKSWTLLFDGGVPTGNDYVNNVTVNAEWNLESLGEKRVYEYQIQWDNSIKISGSANQCPQFKNDYLNIEYTGAQYKTYLFVTSTSFTSEQTVSALPEDAVILDKTNIGNYINSTTDYYCGGNYPLCVSTDGGVTKTQLTSGTKYTYHEGETFYTYTADYALIEDNAAYFAANPSYLQTDPSSTSFTTILANKIKSGSYSKVEFVNLEPSTQLTINSNIISAILYPNGGGTYNKDIRTLDLGQTTIPGLNTKDFIDNTTNGYYVNNISVTDLTIPLVPAVDGQVVVPEDVISTWSTNAVVRGCLPLTTVRIPEGYTKLGDNAFRGFSGISTFVLPSSLREIGNSAFENSGAITAMTLNSGLKYIGKRAFMGTHLSSTMDEPFVFPSSLDKIDDAAFGSIVEFHNVKLVDGLRYIGNSAFYLPACDLTQEVLSVPSSVKYMGPGAFNFRWFKDIYYNSAVAPIAPHGTPVLAQDGSANTSAFDHKIQMGFNGFNPDNTICQNADDAWHGYANRENYQNGDTFFCILHYPANLSEDEHNTYEDVTRIYETYYDRYQTMLEDNGDGTYSEVKVNEDGDCGVGGANFDYNSSNGGGILVKGADVDEAVKSLDGWASTQQKYYRHNVEEGKTTEYTSAAVVTPGFEDTYKGKQYVWPSQSQWMRAFAESACGYQWDGKTLYRPELTVAELKVYNEAGYLTDEQLASLIGILDDAEVVTTASVTDEGLATLYDNLQYMAYISTREFVLADPDTKEDQKVDEFPVDIKAEHWWTLCVPFNMTKAQVTESFGVGTHVCRFSKVDRDVVNKPSTIKLYFQDDVYVHKQVKTYGEDGKYTYAPVVGNDDVADDDIVIYAHESYMIYPTKKQDDKATYVVKNYKAETGSPVPTLINANAENTETEDHTQYRYIGNYSVGYAVDTPVAADEDVPTTASYEFVTTKIPAYSYMYALKKNDTRYKFWFTQSDKITWAPYKCVVQATAKDGGITDDSAFFGGTHESKQISIFGNEGWDDEATDIENVVIIAGSGNDSQVIYNLNGQVMNPNNAVKGVYIKNGKKYFAR